MKALLLTSVALIAAVGFFVIAGEPNPSTPTQAKVYPIGAIEQKNPKMDYIDFSWTENGKTVKLSEAGKGKVVFLNFWATWCPPCRKEIPDIVQISKDMEKDVLVIGIDCFERSTPIDNVKNFYSKNDVSYPTVVATDQKIADAFGGTPGIPTTFIYDKSGKLVEKLVGMQPKETFVTAITKAMGGK